MNPRQPGPQPGALPTELHPPYSGTLPNRLSSLLQAELLLTSSWAIIDCFSTYIVIFFSQREYPPHPALSPGAGEEGWGEGAICQNDFATNFKGCYCEPILYFSHPCRSGSRSRGHPDAVFLSGSQSGSRGGSRNFYGGDGLCDRALSKPEAKRLTISKEFSDS